MKQYIFLVSLKAVIKHMLYRGSIQLKARKSWHPMNKMLKGATVLLQLVISYLYDSHYIWPCVGSLFLGFNHF